mmetsp:Transcript_113425/g.284086  ORF Transcript_113425/g.284086 Transcript_113425/m.284086 type:complete len:247 (-) Transcript_113425:490-1230(-)
MEAATTAATAPLELLPLLLPVLVPAQGKKGSKPLTSARRLLRGPSLAEAGTVPQMLLLLLLPLSASLVPQSLAPSCMFSSSLSSSSSCRDCRRLWLRLPSSSDLTETTASSIGGAGPTSSLRFAQPAAAALEMRRRGTRARMKRPRNRLRLRPHSGRSASARRTRGRLDKDSKEIRQPLAKSTSFSTASCNLLSGSLLSPSSSLDPSTPSLSLALSSSSAFSAKAASRCFLRLFAARLPAAPIAAA